MAYDVCADFDQLFLEAGQRPILDQLRRRQGSQEAAEVVGERVKPEPHGIGRECRNRVKPKSAR
jgi:hypothetical protein